MRHKGQKWLADVISESKVQMHSLPGIAWCIQEPRNFGRKVAYWSRRQWHEVCDQFSRVGNVFSKLFNLRKQSESGSLEDGEPKSPISPAFAAEPLSAISLGRHSETMLSPISERAPSTIDGQDDHTVLSDSGATVINAPPVLSPARTRFKNIVRSVMMVRSASGAASAFGSVAGPRRQRTMSSDAGKSGQFELSPAMVRGSRVAALIPKLKKMEATYDLAAHQALVRHLQFSPDGKLLATSR